MIWRRRSECVAVALGCCVVLCISWTVVLPCSASGVCSGARRTHMYASSLLQRLRVLASTRLGLDDSAIDAELIKIFGPTGNGLPTAADIARSRHNGATVPSSASLGLVRQAQPLSGARLLAGPGQTPSTLLESNDMALVHALTASQQTFVVTDPSLPDNPIVFATQGFYELTGFDATHVLGRNCRFLQVRRYGAGLKGHRRLRLATSSS